MSRNLARAMAVVLSLVLIAAACGSDDDDGGDDTTGDTSEAPSEDIDYEALGLWDDGPCDEAAEPLVIGLMTVFESPVLSLKDQAVALEASAEAFNARGGANGACVEVHTCDDGGNPDQAAECVRELDETGVVATVNDQVTGGADEVAAATLAAGIPRVAPNVSPAEWAQPNSYALDAAGTGYTFLGSNALVAGGITEIGIVRVDQAAASALIGFLEGLYEGEATFPVDLPVPAGTTDFSQFILAADNAGAGGITLAVGEQEGIQVIEAGEQLGTELLIGNSLGSSSHGAIAGLGDFAQQMVFTWSFPPATFDLPIYEVLRADLTASGEEALQTENLKASPMRSWIALYALIRMLRDAPTTELTREGITAMLEEATDVPMLDIFGGEDWTPALDHEGVFSRAGTNYWATWGWDPEADAPEGLEGNFVQTGEVNWDEFMCGSPLGAPEPC